MPEPSIGALLAAIESEDQVLALRLASELGDHLLTLAGRVTVAVETIAKLAADANDR